jgi:hypothetical protein
MQRSCAEERISERESKAEKQPIYLHFGLNLGENPALRFTFISRSILSSHNTIHT